MLEANKIRTSNSEKLINRKRTKRSKPDGNYICTIANMSNISFHQYNSRHIEIQHFGS